MGDFLRKAFYKIKILMQPKGKSRISRGLGQGVVWTHEVSDLRYLQGVYEEDLAAWLKEKMSLGYSFVDIGANAGYFSLLAHKFLINEQQRIIAIEPMRLNLNLIQKHISFNRAERVEVLPVAVADKDRMVEFSDSPNMAANTYNEASSLYKNSPKIAVKARSLDAIVAELGLQNTVLKIDVEGAELDVLKGASEMLSLQHPELILATHECHVKGVEQACLNFLEAKGYVCQPLDEKKLVEGQQDYLCYYKG